MSNKKVFSVIGSEKPLQDRLSEVNKEQSISAKGMFGDPLNEPVPQLIKTHSEKIIENGHNASIVLGRDRPHNRLSGYGGKGHTQAASIDLVAGRLSFAAKSFLSTNQRMWVDPNFEKDASRIYISQKTDIDDNFGLVVGKVGNAIGKSGIGIKSDNLRFIAREGIKLITGTDKFNSQGGEVNAIYGIDLIAGNDDSDLQPMVKGANLAEALKRIVHHIDKLNGIVDSILMTQMEFNMALTHHFHFSPFFGLPTTPSPPVIAAGIKATADHLMQAKRSLMSHKVNLSLFKMNYFLPSGKKYINSRFHALN